MIDRRKRIIESRKAAQLGRRVHAFYRGCKDRRAGRAANPYPAGSVEASCWDAGWQFGGDDPHADAQAPVCRFGPGGDYVRDWPEGGP